MVARPNAALSQITLANLMTHTSGLACNDNDDASPTTDGYTAQYCSIGSTPTVTDPFVIIKASARTR